MTATRTIWICLDCKHRLDGERPAPDADPRDDELNISAESAERATRVLPLIPAQDLITMGFRDPDDHHRDCDLRNSVAAVETDRMFGVPQGEQANDLHDCTMSCEQWDACPYDCHGCGEAAGQTSYAVTLWPAPVTA